MNAFIHTIFHVPRREFRSQAALAMCIHPEREMKTPRPEMQQFFNRNDESPHEYDQKQQARILRKMPSEKERNYIVAY